MSQFVPMIGAPALLVGFCVLLGGARTSPLEPDEAFALMGLGTTSENLILLDRSGRAALTIAFHEGSAMAQDLDRARSWRDFWLALFGAPGAGKHA